MPNFEVHETLIGNEPFTPDDFITEFEKEAEASNPKQTSTTPNYTTQLEFHEYELSQAETRGFPGGQVKYHVGRVALLKRLMYEQA